MLLEKPDRERGFKKERILRVLLNHTGEAVTKYRVAKLADVSEPWTRQYTDKLAGKGFLEDTAVLEPRSLYEEWRHTRVQPNTVEVSLQQPMQLLRDTSLKYGLTTYQAENIHQGFLFTSTTDFYVPEDQIRDWLALVEDEGMLGGGNTRLQATDDHVFYETQATNGYSTVSVPQLIVDLLDEGGPCREAAERLIDKHHRDTGTDANG